MAFKNKENGFLLLFFKLEGKIQFLRGKSLLFVQSVVYSSIIENLFENRSHGRLHYCREKDNQITLNEQSFSFCVKGKV